MNSEQKIRLRNNRIFAFEHMEMMGIVNVTEDSFFAGSRAFGIEAALALAQRHIAEGARMIDIGGESSRPGAAPVSSSRERERVCPVVRILRERFPDIVLSVDTYHAETARAVLESGADMINDISGLTFEPEMAEVIAEAGAAVILMHTPARPDTMQDSPHYGDVVREVHGFLARQIAFARGKGIGRDQIMIDMGIGFGKSTRHNLSLLRNVRCFDDLGCPHLLAVSRKSVIGNVLGLTDPADRLPGTLALTAYGAAAGMAAARVHDVKANLEAARMREALE